MQRGGIAKRLSLRGSTWHRPSLREHRTGFPEIQIRGRPWISLASVAWSGGLGKGRAMTGTEIGLSTEIDTLGVHARDDWGRRQAPHSSSGAAMTGTAQAALTRLRSDDVVSGIPPNRRCPECHLIRSRASSKRVASPQDVADGRASEHKGGHALSSLPLGPATRGSPAPGSPSVLSVWR